MTIHHAPALPIAIALVAGIAAGDAAFGMVGERIIATATIVFAVVAVAVFRWAKACTVAILLAVFCLGGWLIVRQKARTAMPLTGDPVSYDAVVVSEPQVHGRVVMFDMLMLSKPRHTVRASVLRDTVDNRWRDLAVGSGMHATSVMEPGYYGHGYRTFVYYRNWNINPDCLSQLSRWELTRVKALQLRTRLLSRLSAAGLEGDSYAIAAAMALGDKSSLNRELRQTYSEVGAAHVLALSGLHLGIIYFVLSLFVGFVRPRWLGQSLLLLTVWAFVVMVGMSPSVVRAAVMLTLYQMATIAHRPGAGLNIVSVAAIIMLAANPSALFDIGFQLSFLSVVAIIIMYRPLIRLLPESERNWWRPLRYIVDMVAIAIVAQMATAPLVAYYFGTFSSCFLLTSLVAVPAATLILYGTIATLLLSFSATASGIMATALGKLIVLENWLLGLIGGLPYATVHGLSPSKLQVALAYLVIICACAALIILVNRRKINFN